MNAPVCSTGSRRITTRDRHVHMMAAISRSFAAALARQRRPLRRFGAIAPGRRERPQQPSRSGLGARGSSRVASALRTGASGRSHRGDDRRTRGVARQADRRQMWAAWRSLSRWCTRAALQSCSPAVAQPWADRGVHRTPTLGFRSWVEAMAGDHEGAARFTLDDRREPALRPGPEWLAHPRNGGMGGCGGGRSGVARCGRGEAASLHAASWRTAGSSRSARSTVCSAGSRSSTAATTRPTRLFASGLALEDWFGAPVFAAYTRFGGRVPARARRRRRRAIERTTLLAEAIATADRLGMAQVAAEARTLTRPRGELVRLPASKRATRTSAGCAAG